MSDPNGNTWTWYKEGPALHRKEGVLTCDVIRNHVGLLQQAAMRIVRRAVQLTLSIPPRLISRRIGLAGSTQPHALGAESRPMLWFRRC